jgi:hypothetical protein
MHADLFNSDKILINAVESFYLLAPTNNTKVGIKILDATLFITQFELNPILHLAHVNVLAMKRKTHYPVTHTRSKLLQRVLRLSKSL